MLNVLLWEILRKLTLRIMWWLVGGENNCLLLNRAGASAAENDYQATIFRSGGGGGQSLATKNCQNILATYVNTAVSPKCKVNK